MTNKSDKYLQKLRDLTKSYEEMERCWGEIYINLFDYR